VVPQFKPPIKVDYVGEPKKAEINEFRMTTDRETTIVVHNSNALLYLPYALVQQEGSRS